MDTSYLSQQVTTIINQLHGYFDEIGVPSHERDSRESELFAALSETLHNQLKLVASEKHELTEQARQLIRTIRQMEASLDDTKTSDDYDREDDELRVTHPLLQCIEQLKQKHKTISKLHRERYEQVKKLAEALHSYASHLEPSFLSIKLPPQSPNAKISPTFDISPSYVASLDSEFTKVYEEYNRRVALVQSMAEEIVMLWTELGTPQAQIDSTIVKNYRETPEQLGLHQDDITRVKAKREKLLDEKRARERRLKELRSTVEQLWEKLGIDESERRAFLASNRGCGMRAINEFEDELSKLEEMKRQNLHLFVEDARFKLQELWDGLYFSEEEMLEFTPAFSDVYSDALLSAHEAEIARLEALKQQRAPILASVDKYRALVKEDNDLRASSQDASRLLAKGNKGEKRDPTRLLREEKMRKRVEKQLPKVEEELRKVLEAWEDEYGRPFLVHGERYLDELDSRVPQGRAPSARSKTPINPPPAANTKNGTMRGPPPPRSKTPTASIARNPLSSSVIGAPSTIKPSAAKSTVRGSPSKIPSSRQPLGALADGKNSPERRPRTAGGFRSAADEQNYSTTKAINSPGKSSTLRGNPSSARMGPPRLPPPPKMKDFFPPTPTPTHYSDTGSDHSSVIVRHMPMEDPYDDRSYRSHPSSSTLSSHAGSVLTRPPPPRQISATSSSSAQSAQSYPSTAPSASENWETYTDASADEDEYYSSLRMRGGKRLTPEGGYDGEDVGKKARVGNVGLGLQGFSSAAGLRMAPAAVHREVTREREGTGESEGWTDDGSVF
ncbi:hypothetical protein K461DRAFT_329872 [Myriangium duriaei CBS 260.36]|uniref:Anaphase spindle elongation protein 1 n=1 Tax=Myriangium duriaei CBS 260.36 TaxID=1168546 RepID=A0A9P4ITK7_9PEZI|nr:hypothetical protein K461DRAFT_329872 [Myriangium duriaei CBS 260.36]